MAVTHIKFSTVGHSGFFTVHNKTHKVLQTQAQPLHCCPAKIAGRQAPGSRQRLSLFLKPSLQVPAPPGYIKQLPIFGICRHTTQHSSPFPLHSNQPSMGFFIPPPKVYKPAAEVDLGPDSDEHYISSNVKGPSLPDQTSPIPATAVHMHP